MFKKLATIGLAIVLIGAVAVSITSLIDVDSALAFRGNGDGQSNSQTTGANNGGNGYQNLSTDPLYDCENVPYQTPAYQGQNSAGINQSNNGSQNLMLGSQGQKGVGNRVESNTGVQNQTLGSQGQNGAGNQGENSTGIPQVKANVEAWITVEGTVSGVDLYALTIVTGDGDNLLVQLGPAHYWNDLGIVLTAGDTVEITGFFEDGSFNAGTITLLETGETMNLRETSGRPLWSGGERSGSSRGRTN